MENILLNCSRKTYPMGKDAMRWANHIGNRCFAIFLSFLINKPISDLVCGTKVFSRKFFDLMKKNGSWESKSDPFRDFSIIFETANYNTIILNLALSNIMQGGVEHQISRWIDGIKLLNICWKYMISEI